MGSNNLLFGAFIIMLLGVGGLLLILSRLSRRRGALPMPVAPPETATVATIRRVLSTEKLDRHELKISLLLDVKLPDAGSYQAETAWVIRVARIAGMQLGQSFPVEIDAGAVRPLVSWAKLWHEGYTPLARD